MWISISENYECSDLGQIRNKRNGYIIKQFVGKDGYMRVQFDGKTRTVHRVIASAFINNPLGLEQVNHIDGNKQNNTVSNLEWISRSGNMKHAYMLGLKNSKGEKNSRCKLNIDSVEYIKNNYLRGDKKYGAKALSKKFGVAAQTICAVVSGKNWS